MLIRAVYAALVPVLLAGCLAEPWPDAPLMDRVEFRAEHEEWQTNRAASKVRPPGGEVLWIGLWELAQGETRFGSDTELPIVFPANRSPAFAGTLVRDGQDVRVEPARGAALSIGDSLPITAVTPLDNSRAEEPTVVHLGSLGMRVHSEPGTDRLWLRAWDAEHPDKDSFTLPGSYPLDQSWRVMARLEEFPEPRTIVVPDVQSGTVEYVAPGELVFQIEGREHSILPVLQGNTTYLVMIWDSTAHTDTYQGGRYMRVPFVDSTGWTVMDFNRAYNPQCVFSPYSVCALPPRENRLPVAITAGEKRPETLAF